MEERIVDSDTQKKEDIKKLRSIMDATTDLLNKINPRLAKDAENASKNQIRPNR